MDIERTQRTSLSVTTIITHVFIKNISIAHSLDPARNYRSPKYTEKKDINEASLGMIWVQGEPHQRSPAYYSIHIIYTHSFADIEELSHSTVYQHG